MYRQFGVVVAAVALVAGVGCGRPREEAKPVAAAVVSLSRSEIPAGSPVDVRYRFVVAHDAPPFAEDYVVFVHFLDGDGEQMWTDDHLPPTPTRQWKAGETIEYERPMFVPKFPYVGPGTVEVGLYSRKTGDRLILAGDHSGMRAYRAASFALTEQSDDLRVTFKDGWHDAEGGEGGLEWQWSKQEGTIAFRNPKRDAVLLLQVDQAAPALPEPQHVEVRYRGAAIDSFALPPGSRELRRIPLPADQLGGSEAIELSITVDKTFVPAKIPALHSADSRELGVRVFRAYIQPK